MRKAVVSGSWFEGQRLVSPRSWLEPSHPPPPASRRFSVAGRRRSSVRLSRPPWASTPIGVTTRRATGLAALALAIGVVSMLAGTSAVAEVLRLDAAAAAARAVEVSDLAIAAGKRADAGDAAVSAADAGRWPTVSTSASIAQRSSVPEFQLPFTMPGQPSIVLAPDITTVYSSGLRVQQAILAGGAINAQRRATRADSDALGARRIAVQADLRLAGHAAYWDAVRTCALRESAGAQKRRAERLLEDTRALLAVGMAVRADLLATEERLASSEVGLVRAELAQQTATAALRSLLHLSSDVEIELADTLAAASPRTPAPVEELISTALRTRPELAASRAQLDALNAREALTTAPTKPQIAALAQWDFARPNSRYFPISDQWKDSWSVGLSASWTLFDGGRARAERRSSQAQQAALASELADFERRIRLEVESARRELHAAIATIAAADAAHAAALARQQATSERHGAGLATMAEMLDAESQLSAAEAQQIGARAGAWQAAAVLARTVGQ
jgi:outer membrane protein TolC